MSYSSVCGKNNKGDGNRGEGCEGKHSQLLGWREAQTHPEGKTRTLQNGNKAIKCDEYLNVGLEGLEQCRRLGEQAFQCLFVIKIERQTMW